MTTSMKALRRLRNGIRKVAAGLRPFGESVWPGLRNDLFVAHESIYEFAAQFALGSDVLDAGCGTGYGTAILAREARSAVGVDFDAMSIRYARRRFVSDRIVFAVADLQSLIFDHSFDLIVASNSLEHLHDPSLFLRAAEDLLKPGGVLVVAVPPIYTAADMTAHEQIHYHRANMTVRGWLDLIAQSGLDLSCFIHTTADPTIRPDFSSMEASALRASDFIFTPIDRAQMAERGSITAVFVAAKRTT